jgi:hypothetical protein
MTYSTELKNRPPPKPNARHAYRNSFGTFVWFRVNSLAVPSQQTTIFFGIFRLPGPARTARFTAHSAFEDPTAPANVLPRESIEVRTLVFHNA